MKKIIIAIVVALVVIGGTGALAFNHFTSKNDVKVSEKTNEKDEPVIEIVEENPEDLEDEFPLDMSEMEVQSEIHAMSHQKVAAEDKWGFLPMTQDRIMRLLEVVEANEYENSQLYINILTKWSKGDFSSADRDHNAIWELQGGTIGRASGLLTPEQEKAFIKEHYDIVE